MWLIYGCYEAVQGQYMHNLGKLQIKSLDLCPCDHVILVAFSLECDCIVT
jgi:hypothetical protein